MEATPQSVYKEMLMDAWRIEDASNLAGFVKRVMQLNVQLELW